MNIQKVNNELIKFWNDSLYLNDEDKKELEQYKGSDYQELAPSKKLFDAAKSLRGLDHVLDYGCGNGWASIVINKSGCPHVDAVDVGEKIIETAKTYASVFDSNINAFLVSPDWLTSVKDETYDGIFCSNVLDVVPLETSKEIIRNLHRIIISSGILIVGLNFYMPKEAAKQRGLELVDNRYLFVNDVLRLMSLSDEEWSNLFSNYFEIVRLEHFAWPGEAQETRRLFYLKKK